MKKITKRKPRYKIPLTAHAFEVDEPGKIVYDIFKSGLRFIVMRATCSWAAYIGVPIDHPLAGIHYNDFPNINCHGGLTFSGGGKNWPPNYYWYGWDYGHCGDTTTYDHKFDKNNTDKDWTIAEVIADSQNAIDDFKILREFSEKIIVDSYRQKNLKN